MSLHPDQTKDMLPAGQGPIGATDINAKERGLADWLCLAATPTFAIMALLTAIYGGSDMVCSATMNASPLSGMVAMYLLMSVFHSAPWLRLISITRNAARRS